MNLILDVGNSFVKLAVFQQDELLEKQILEKEGLQKKGEEILSRFPQITNVMLSNVSSASFALPRQLKTKVQVTELNRHTKLPFNNLYATPTTLGNDRKALVAAAAKYYPEKNVLVIDAGTCLTFDFKNSDNEYLGGAISPGLRMRFKSLHTFTAKLPELAPGAQFSLVGNSTDSSIYSGVTLGMIKEIDGIIDEYRAQFQEISIIFTGGDAQFLSMRLKNSIFANSNFLLEGLNYILEFNNIQ